MKLIRWLYLSGLVLAVLIPAAWQVVPRDTGDALRYGIGWLAAGSSCCRLRAEPLAIELCLIPLDSSFLPARIATSHRGFTLPRPKGCVGNVVSRAGCLSPSHPYGDKGNCPPRGQRQHVSGAVSYGRTPQRAEISAAWGDAEADTQSGAEPGSTLCRWETLCGLCARRGWPFSSPSAAAESSSDEIPGAEGVHKDAAKRGPGHRTGRLMHLMDNTGRACQITTVIFMCCYRFSGRCSARCSILQLPAGRAQEPFYLMCINPCILPHFCPQMALIRSTIQH